MLNEKEIIECLKAIDIFKDIKDDEELIHGFYKLCSVKQYPKDEAIITEGDSGDCLYILIEGAVRIMKKTLQNEIYTVAILNANNHVFFGEVALIDSDKRSATVITENNCVTLVVNRDEFVKFCDNNLKFGYLVTLQIAKRLSKSLRKMNNDVLTLYQALVDEVEGVI